MDSGREIAWRSAVVPVPAKGRARVGHGPGPGDRLTGHAPATAGDREVAPSDVGPSDDGPSDDGPNGGGPNGGGPNGGGPNGDGPSGDRPGDVGDGGGRTDVATVGQRERAVEAMVAWCESGDRPVWMVEGPAAAGKTRLVAEVADRLSDRLTCGWARPGLGGHAVTAAARNGRQVLLLVDDAETRADMLELLDAVGEGPIRVVIVARDFGSWWTDLLARLSPRQRENLCAGRTVMGGGTVAALSPGTLALRDLRLGTADPRGRAATTLATADPGSAEVLLRQAALVVALSTRVGQLGPAAVRSALRDLFEEQEGYWRRTSTEVTASGQPPPVLRSALTSAAMLGVDGLGEAATVLRRVPALAVGAADRLARLAVWWHGLYTRLGDSSLPTPRLPSWLGDRLPDGNDSSGVAWTVAALDAERRATSTLSRMTVDAHREVWPVAASRSHDIAVRNAAAAHDAQRRAVAAAGPVDEALAWLTQELELGDGDLDTMAEAIGYSSSSLKRTGVVLARRLLAAAIDGHCDGDLAGDQRRAALTAVLGARYSEVGRWDEARRHTEQAVETFRLLTDLDRDRFLPDLAGAVANLATCLVQLGENDEALRQSYEAVSLHRELVNADADLHRPELARALTNLAATLSRSGRRTAALGAAGQAVALYRELAEANRGYTAELEAAEHNWRTCQAVLDRARPG